MSTTTCAAPDEVGVEQRQPLGGVGGVGERGLEEQRLAEDRRGLGERHRRGALDRRAIGERDVVIRVPELVRERRHRVVTAVEVHHHAADVAGDRHAVRAAALAVADLGVDPSLGERAFRQRRELRGEAAERVAHQRGRERPLHLARVPDRREQIPPREPAVVAEHTRLGAEVAAEARQRVDDRFGHRVERAAVDVVVAERGLEIVVVRRDGG